MQKKTDPASGNVTNGRTSHPARPQLAPIVDVQVKTQIVDGLELPHTILLSSDKEFIVERVYGSKRDPERDNALRYSVRIGGQTFHVWQRENGTWFVKQ